MMIYAIFMIVTIFALSLHYAKSREKPSLQWLRRSVDLSSKLSFGIYLTQTASLAIYGLVIDWINPYLSDVVFHWVIFWCCNNKALSSPDLDKRLSHKFAFDKSSKVS